jgi:hypothetical protein
MEYDEKERAGEKEEERKKEWTDLDLCMPEKAR